MNNFQDEPTKFRKLLGDNPKIRVLEYLLEGRELDHSLTDIAEWAGIDRVTLFRLWPQITKEKIVIHTRNIGNAKLFKLNMKSFDVQILAEMFDKIINEGFGSSAEKHTTIMTKLIWADKTRAEGFGEKELIKEI